MPVSLSGMLDILAGFAARSTKPVAVILEPAHREAEVAQVRAQFVQRGVLALPSAERAAIALRQAIGDHRFRAGLD